MREFIELHGDRYLDVDPETRREVFIQYALKKNVEQLRRDLEDYGIRFDTWFSEQKLHDSKGVEETIQLLIQRGHTYEKEGALWFEASKFGGDKDEVLVRNNGIPTILRRISPTIGTSWKPGILTVPSIYGVPTITAMWRGSRVPWRRWGSIPPG